MNMQIFKAALLPHDIPKDEPMSVRTYFYLLKTVLFGADTTTIRWLLANGSFAWFMTLALSPESFDRPTYIYMKTLFPVWAWALFFFLHCAGSYWRMLDPVRRTYWALAINSMGFLLWFTSTVCVNVAIGKVSPSIALEISMVFASAWALYRTGLRREIVSP